MKKLKTEIVIICILWLSIISSLCLNYKFDIFFIFGIIGLSIVTLTFKKHYEISLSSLVLILIFSTFNLVKFNLTFNINFGLGSIPNLISIPNFILLMILVYNRRNEILDLKQKWFTETEEEKESGKNAKIEFFKREFKNLSELELNRKLTEDKLTEEAKNAVNELIKLRKTTKE
jgi:predicted membrane protein